MSELNPFILKGKTILVTGASSGIGRSIAILCSKMGADVFLNGRSQSKLEATLFMMEDSRGNLVPADLTNEESVREMIKELPSLDGVVHCAGVGQRIPCKHLTANDINMVMDSNFIAPVLLQAELLRSKKIKKGASIVFISSIASWSPSIGNSIYSASKGAIISFAKCLSLELAPRNVRVNCISPAMVWTGLSMNDSVELDKLKEDESCYPLKRYGKPEDIANLTIYLLSDASSWMTGSNLQITGGGKLS